MEFSEKEKEIIVNALDSMIGAISSQIIQQKEAESKAVLREMLKEHQEVQDKLIQQ